MDLKVEKSAYLKLKESSTKQQISLNEVKEMIKMYIERTTKTGEQLGWEYGEAAFPYAIEEKEEGNTKYLYLKAKNEMYNYLIVGVGKEEADGAAQDYIQIVLPDEDYRTPGDQNKAGELAKYMGKYLKAELHLFNGRIIYNNPRK